MLSQKNTKKQGDVGLGLAIGYFVSKGYTISLPLTDSQEYDLVVDHKFLDRVQVKTTSYKNRSGNYYVSLTMKGGNKYSNKIKSFDKEKIDSILIIIGEGTYYWIPVRDIEANNSITLYKACDKHIVGSTPIFPLARDDSLHTT